MDKLNAIEIINKSGFSVETQFHVLKHFNSIDDEFYEKLINANYSKIDIAQQLKLQSSKFYSLFSTNLKAIVERVLNGFPSSEIKLNPISLRIEILFEFSNAEYPNGIGTDYLLHKNELTEEQIENIQRRSVENPHIYITNGKAITTNKLNFVIEQKENKYQIITIYPGKYAPPFPDEEKQNHELFMVCKTFWDEHVFVGG